MKKKKKLQNTHTCGKISGSNLQKHNLFSEEQQVIQKTNSWFSSF